MYKKGLDHISAFLQTLKFKALYGMQKAAKENGKKSFTTVPQSSILTFAAVFLICSKCLISLYPNVHTVYKYVVATFDFATQIACFGFFWSCRDRLGLAFEEWV
jgi:hypothetical protein